MSDSRGEEEASPDDAGGVKNEDGVENEAISENPSVDQRILVCLTALCETGVVSLLSLFFISRNLCAAPILVLSEKE